MFYHVSDKDLGKRITLKARVPMSACKQFENVTIPRVCFSPSILQCLISKEGIANRTISALRMAAIWALHAKQHKNNPAVYATNQELYRVTTKLVNDANRTQEHWSKRNIRVSRKGYVCLDTLCRKGEIALTDKAFHTLTQDECETVWMNERMAVQVIYS